MLGFQFTEEKRNGMFIVHILDNPKEGDRSLYFLYGCIGDAQRQEYASILVDMRGIFFVGEGGENILYENLLSFKGRAGIISESETIRIILDERGLFRSGKVRLFSSMENAIAELGKPI